MKRQIGKNTLGGGKKMDVELREFDRSTHDLSRIFRTTAAPGVLIPFLKEPVLPGDTWDINLEAECLTHPTIGPLFGSLKLQLDIFTADARLYQAKLHNDPLGVGMNMAALKLPLLQITADDLDWTKPIDDQQINPSCILAYLGIRGLGYKTPSGGTLTRNFNAIPLLAYWDVFKNYYANKQEPNAAMIHNTDIIQSVTSIVLRVAGGASYTLPQQPDAGDVILKLPTVGEINYSGTAPNPEQIMVLSGNKLVPITEVFLSIINNVGGSKLDLADLNPTWNLKRLQQWTYAIPDENTKPQIKMFPLDNIDTIRQQLLTYANTAAAYVFTSSALSPIGDVMKKEGNIWSKTTPLEGLALKTYQSDLFQNWINTAFITGSNSVNEISRVSTAGGSFTIDTLTMKRKIYMLLNAVAISGGSYGDYIKVNYNVYENSAPETPVYHGGLSKEIVFQEVVSTAASDAEGNQPVGTLAGRGVLGKKHKGGYVRIKVKEYGWVMGIVSITPRIDYSQGNDWDGNMLTMDDWHKPYLDGIGFQDRTTDEMAFWDTSVSSTGVTTFKSAGKQPAWINYMTSYNKTYGNFAIQTNQMFMTLNRRYTPNATTKSIKDLTTYIDPSLYNYIFAYTRRDAMNFWLQIGVNAEVRRVMSAKIMPQG